MKTAFDAIQLAPNEKIKVWDKLITISGVRNPYELEDAFRPHKNKMDSYQKFADLGDLDFIGRVRILAVMGKKPQPLDNIRFSVSWCAPSDLGRYTRERANMICVGRWNKAFTGNSQFDANCWQKNPHTGIIPHLDTLSGFTENALAHVNGHLPKWACEMFTNNELLDQKITSSLQGNFVR